MASERLRAWVRLRVDLLLIVLPLTALVAPLALGRSFWLRDIVRYLYPMKFYLRERLLQGEVPLWNPRDGLGRPFMGMLQSGVFDPLGVLLLLPAPRGVDLYMAAHFFIAGVGTRAWLRAMGHDARDASLGGSLFALSGYFVSVLAGNGTYVFSVAFVPWMLALVARDFARPQIVARSVALALLFAWMLAAGDPMAVYFGGACAIAQAMGHPSNAPRLRALASLAVAALILLPLAAVLWIPAIELTSVARHGGVPLAEASHFAFHPARILEFIWPGAFGAPHTPGWFVHSLYAEGTGDRREPLASGVYVGLATLPLAAAALASGRRRAVDVAFALLALLALVIAMGLHTPVWAMVFRFVPGARYFRLPEKYLFVTTIAFIPLAMRGLVLAFERPALALRFAIAWWLLLLCGAVFAPVVAPAIGGALGGVPVGTVRSALRTRAWWSVAVATAMVVPLAALMRGKLSLSAARWLTAVVLVADLFFPARGLALFTPSTVYARSPFARAILAAAPPGERHQVRLYRPITLDLGTDADRAALDARSLAPNCGMADGIAHLDGYEVFYTPREKLLWSSLRSAPLQMLRVANTRFALLADSQVPPGAGGTRIVVHDRRTHATLLEVPGVAPRVYLAIRVTGAPDAASAAEALRAADFVPGRSAVIEGASSGDASGACHVEADLAERIEITCTADRGGYLIVSDLFFPGWMATVRGVRAEILPANVTMRAVRVPPGVSRVVMRYVPSGWPWALWVSLGSLAVCLAYSLCARRTRRTV